MLSVVSQAALQNCEGTLKQNDQWRTNEELFMLNKIAVSVCVGVLGKVIADMSSDDQGSMDKLNEKVREVCGGAKGKEQKFVSVKRKKFY